MVKFNTSFTPMYRDWPDIIVIRPLLFTNVPFRSILPIPLVSKTMSPVPDAVNKTSPVLTDVNEIFPVPFDVKVTVPLVDAAHVNAYVSVTSVPVPDNRKPFKLINLAAGVNK